MSLEQLKMERRDTPKSHLCYSRVCLGTMTFGGQTDEANAAAMLDYCLEQGVNFVDTANVYNAGRSEEMVGRLLRGRRDRVILASKVGIKVGDAPYEQGLSRAAIHHGIENSLRRLQTDYLDIYYLHTPDDTTPLEESLAVMDKLVRAGKVRCVAASNYAGWQVCQMLWLAERNGWQAVEMTQPMQNLVSRGIEQEFLPMCREFRLGAVAYNPLAGGLLTGKHHFETTLPGTRFDGNQHYRDRYWHEVNFAAVAALGDTARAAGMSLVDLSLRWIYYHGGVDGVILGASRLEQLQQNLTALAGGPLPPAALEACDRVWRQLRGVTPQYNR